MESLLARGVYFDDGRGIILGSVLTELEWQKLKDVGRLPVVFLADAGGKVVFDSTGEANGKLLNSSEKANALAIRV